MVTPQSELLDEIRASLANGSTDPNTGDPVRITATQLRAVLEALLAANYPKPVQQDGTEVEAMPSGFNFVGAVVTRDAAGIVTVTITGGTGATLRFGTGAPADSLGANGDSYLASDTGVFYLKASGAYTEQYTPTTEARITELAQAAIQAAVTGNTEDGIVVEWQSDGTLDFTVDALTADERHDLEQVPGLIEATQDIVVEREYAWADSSDGDIAFRSDAPPTPWLTDALWDDEWTISAGDATDNYLVLRIGIDADVTVFRVERTRGTVTHEYTSSGFKRIHHAETGYQFYANPNVTHRTGDVFQVQEGTLTGEATEYRGHVGDASFAAPDGNGNLAVTVTTISDLVTAIDELALGGGGGGGGFTLRYGAGVPAGGLGADGDWYLRTSEGRWYQKVSGTWHGRYAPPALSDVAPLATSTSADEGSGLASSREDHIHVGLVVTDTAPEDADGTAADAGTSPMAARADHVHEVPSATTSAEGISERATGDEARAGTDTTRHMTPQRVSQVFTDRAGDATPEDVGTADTGTATNFSREDHVHGGGGGGGPDLYDSIPPSIGTDGAIGTSGDAARGDHTHGGQRAVSDNIPEDVGTAAAGTHAAASSLRPRARRHCYDHRCHAVRCRSRGYGHNCPRHVRRCKQV